MADMGFGLSIDDNADETGVITKPGKVFDEIGRRKVYTITAAERGKTHTIMSCVSVSSSTLPPLMVYPRKRSVPYKMRAVAVSLKFLITSGLKKTFSYSLAI